MKSHALFGMIFDWDGVIVDSSLYHEKSWGRLALEENKELPHDHFKKGFGMRNEVIIPNLLKWTADPHEVRRIADRKEEIYRELMVEGGIELLPGVRQFLIELESNEIPCVVGSSTPRLNISVIIDLLGIGHFFKDIVASEDVTVGKPDPQVFILAAHRMGLPPSKCVVVEDALVGIEAAHAGGMKVIAVATTNPPLALHNADCVVSSLEEVSLKLVSGLI